MADTRKVLIWVTGGSVLLCSICGMGLFNGFGQPERQYRAELAEGVKVGLPSRPEEYQKSILATENAALYYMEAASKWERFRKSNKDLTSRLQNGYTDKQYPLSQATSDVLAAQPIFALLDAARSKPNSCFNHPYGNGMAELFPELAAMKTFVKLRTRRAQIRARESNFAAAFDELEKASAIPHQLAQDNPQLINMLVEISCRAIVGRALEQILCQQGHSPTASRVAERVLAAMGPTPSLKDAMRGEYAVTLGTMKMLEDPKKRGQFGRMGTDFGEEESQDSQNPLSGMMDLPSIRYSLQAGLIRQARLAYLDLPADTSDEVAMEEALKAIDNRAEKANSPTDILAKIIMPVYRQAGEAVFKTLAQERLLRILAASLSQPSGVKIPVGMEIDPFTHKPFRIAEHGNRFMVWSTGADKHDNGGLAIRPPNKTESNSWREFDIVIGYPYIPKTQKERERDKSAP